MKHLGTQTITTERLVLRRFILDDAPSMYKNWASDLEVTKFLAWPAHSSEEVSLEILKEWTSNYSKNDFYQWAIAFKDDINNPIGSIGIVDSNDKLEIVHFGYCIGKAYWNKGITSEALSGLIKFFFEEVGVNKVESKHDPNNPHSGNVMKKCGMAYEGTLRQSGFSNVGICDFSFYSILKSEYFSK